MEFNFSLLLPYFEKARDFTTGLPGKVMEGWQGIRGRGRGFFICMRVILGGTFLCHFTVTWRVGLNFLLDFFKS